MSWNYRVLRQVERLADGREYVHFGIHEVYYDDLGEPSSCTASPCAPFGETLEEIRMDAKMILGAFDLPVLEYDSFGAKKGV